MADRLYLHGWGLHGGIWAETVARLPGDAPDLPGYGDTLSVTPYTAETLADAVAARLDGPTDVIGWSMGGMTALALAARHPDKVRRLALVGTSPAFVNRPGWGHGLDAEVVEGFARALSQDYQGTLQRFLALQARGDDEARAVIARLRQQVLDQEPRPETLAAGMDLLRQVDLRDIIDQVVCPTLVVHGAYDALCPVAAGRWLAAFLPDATLAEHPRASHAPFLSHPAWFVETVSEFLHG